MASLEESDPFGTVDVLFTSTVETIVELPINFDDQKKLNWCWAAVGLELCKAKPGRAFGQVNAPSQRDLVRSIFGNEDDRTHNVATSLRQLHESGWLEPRYRRISGDVRTLGEKIRDSIDNDNLVSVIISWSIDASHNVCAYGYSVSETGKLCILMYDPCGIDSKNDNRFVYPADPFGDYPVVDPSDKSTRAGWISGVYAIASE